MRILETTTTILHNLSEGISFDLPNVNLHLRFVQILFRGDSESFRVIPQSVTQQICFQWEVQERWEIPSWATQIQRRQMLFSHLRAAPTLIPWTSMLSNSPVIQRMIMLLLSIRKKICERQTCQLCQGQRSDWLAVWSMAILPEPVEPFRRRLVNVKLTNCVKDWVASKQLAECVTPHLKILYTTYNLFYIIVRFSSKQCRFTEIFYKVLLFKFFVAPHL